MGERGSDAMVVRPGAGLASLALALVLTAATASAQQQPPPQPYPQPYPYPYPYYPYPYPYPYQYPYPYPQYPPPQGQPAPGAPVAPAKPAKPPLRQDWAVATSPFFDGLVTIGAYEGRFSHVFDIGLQAGAFLAGRLRLTARIVPFFEPPEDSADEDDESFPGSSEWRPAASDSPNVMFGGSVGIAALSRTKFVLSPSILVLRTDDTDYGTIAGLAVPFEWVAESGLRIGFEVGVGRSFGGDQIEACQNTGAPQSCVPGEERRVDREAGAAFMLHFQLGFGLVPSRRE